MLCLLFILAADHTGLVKFGGVPVPGVSVTLTQDGRTYGAITDPLGSYTISGIASKAFAVDLEMQLFAPQHREFADASAQAEWELAALPSVTAAISPSGDFQRAQIQVKSPAKKAAEAPVNAELAQRAADGLLINGSINNGASSPFAQLPAFGNFRRGQRSLYNGTLGIIANNALFDARQFSLTGQDTPKPAYSHLQGLFAFGGPIKIPGWIRRNGPVFTVNYQWTRNSNASTQTGLMPTALAWPEATPTWRPPSGSWPAGPSCRTPRRRWPATTNCSG